MLNPTQEKILTIAYYVLKLNSEGKNQWSVDIMPCGDRIDADITKWCRGTEIQERFSAVEKVTMEKEKTYDEAIQYLEWQLTKPAVTYAQAVTE